MTSSSLSLRHAALGDVDHEFASTRRLLERIPDDKLDWRPHEKSSTLGRLATHVAELPGFALMMLTTDEVDFMKPMPKNAEARSRDEILRTFDQTSSALRERLNATDDETLRQKWTLRAGDHVLSSQPRAASLRTIGINHLIHHRGQLSVYLRMVDVPLPSIYGPTADEGWG